MKEESGVSKTVIADVFQALIHRHLAEHEQGKYLLKLTLPLTLLNEWAAFNDFATTRKFVDYYSPQQDISKFFENLKEIKNVDYAVTGLAGALFIKPFVRPTNVHIYVKSEEDAQKLANLLKLVPVESSGNVRFAIAGSSGVFYGAEKKDGVCVVSLPQLYVDLYNYPARGREAARELYKVIEDNWEARKASMHA